MRPDWADDVTKMVSMALAEDIKGGDITAELIDPEQMMTAKVITREAAVVCGVAWVNEVFRQLDGDVNIRWHFKDGDRAVANDCLFELHGRARSLLTGERSALRALLPSR